MAKTYFAKDGLIQELETSQCTVKVFDTGWSVDFYKIYCIKSYHHKNGKVTTRFGTKAQIKSILKTYKPERKFKL